MSNLQSLPLIVDLDHTLLQTDSLHEQIVRGFCSNPLALLHCFLKLLQGRAAFKAALEARFGLDVEYIPLREPFLTWLREQRENGIELHLCTAAHQSIANRFAQRVGLFTTVIGSDAVNLKGRVKADHLTSLFPDGFVYAGDSRADLSVWRRAAGIILVGADASVSRAARTLGKPITATFPPQSYGLKDWISAIRAHHWSKNALIFLPLLLGHDWYNRHAGLNVALGFLVLLLLISSTYLANDLADLSNDRAHWSKRHRPIASGRISILAALCAAVGGIIVSLSIGFYIAEPFGVALFCYLTITLAYSFGLKRIPLLDTIIIAFLFTLRLIMGTVLASQQFSAWLLAFSMLFFFSLATAKRHTELLRTLEMGGTSARGYRAEDATVTALFGVSTGVSSLVILALYFVDSNFQHGLYQRPEALWIIPLLVGILLGRVWLLAQRGEMHDDPVSFVLRDRAILGLGLVAAAAFVYAL